VTPDGGVVRFADAMLDDLVAYGRHFQPDLIVYEPFNLAGSLAAAALGVPDVRLLWGPDSSIELDLDEDLILGPRAARLGIDRVRLTGTLTLDPCPAPMQVPIDAPTHPMRFVPYNGTAVVPAWLREPATRPRVCVTWGTMMAALGLADLVGAPRVVHALAALDIEVVVALAATQVAALGDLPANVRVARSPLALHLVLPTCQALVHQGGAGTTMTGLACGVPQLVLPQVSDQHFNADRLARTGAGRQLAADEAEPDVIRDRVVDLLERDQWRDSAREMRRRFEARPSPADLVPVLGQLAETAHAAGVPTQLI
jgi:UDP:flavonoid glycosyltransferase YjiC (YdhE family)